MAEVDLVNRVKTGKKVAKKGMFLSVAIMAALVPRWRC